MTDRPKIPNIPGVKWRAYAGGAWEARWRPRADLKARGYPMESQRLWIGDGITEVDVAYIQQRAQLLQDEMLVWGRGGLPQVSDYDGTFASLVECYLSDSESSYKTVEYASRQQYDKLCKRVRQDMGDWKVEETGTREINQQHRAWRDGSGVAMAHACISMLRMLTGFGATILEDAPCQRLRGLLSLRRFPMGDRRQVFLSFEQASNLCDRARANGMPAVALAQAIQFELALRQKDVIGAWVPQDDAALSDITDHGRKWIKGLRWETIDANLILRHRTSKKKKMLVADLNLAPLVMQELTKSFGSTLRTSFPLSGPIIVDNKTGQPYSANTYRYIWRQLATELGIPKGVQNRDSRSGAITEALAAGAQPDDVRKAATHSQLSTTMIYSRGEEEAGARVAAKRIASRMANDHRYRNLGDNEARELIAAERIKARTKLSGT